MIANDDELDAAMMLRDKAIAERDEARIEALHWRGLYEALLQQVQARNLRSVRDEEGFPEYRFALKNLLNR